MKKLLLTAFAASMGLVAANAADVQISADITTTTTWTSDNVYFLNDVIFVKNGATLIIEPGTIIRGKTTGSSYNTTALWITRGSKIIAQGTKEAPIVMTDENDTNVPSMPDSIRFASTNPYSTINPTASMQTKAKLWGGLVICGNAYATVDTSGSIVGPLVEDDMYAEGLSSSGDTQYGGADDDDNSGIVSFVSLRYGGYGFGSSSEINGISLYAVGRQTKIDHVEVVGNKDDGIEFFGGTVNTKHIAIMNIGDDSFDVDQGYRGRAQFLFMMQGFCDVSGTAGSGIGNHGFEMDGVEKTDGNMPWALQRYENVTLIGHNYIGTGAAYTAGKEANSNGFQLDDNCRPQFQNVIAMDVDSVLCAVESEKSGQPDSFEGLSVPATEANYPTHVPGTGAETDVDYYYTSQKETMNQTAFENFVVYNCASDYYMYETDSNNALRSGQSISTAGRGWNEATSLPIRYMERESATDADRPMPAVGGGLLPNMKLIDPRPLAKWANSPYTADDDGFSSPVSYYGAFAPEGPTWLDEWTAMSQLGMITNADVSATGEIILDEAGFSVGFEASIGTSYTLEESTDSGSTWSAVAGATSVVADKVNMTLTDFGVDGVASKLYRVVSQ